MLVVVAESSDEQHLLPASRFSVTESHPAKASQSGEIISATMPSYSASVCAVLRPDAECECRAVTARAVHSSEPYVPSLHKVRTQAQPGPLAHLSVERGDVSQNLRAGSNFVFVVRASGKCVVDEVLHAARVVRAVKGLGVQVGSGTWRFSRGLRRPASEVCVYATS